jgi:hypothetical protein
MRVVLISEKRLEELVAALCDRLQTVALKLDGTAKELFREADIELHDLRRKICDDR